VTLVVAIRTREGAVLAADSQLTFRDAAARVVDRRRVTKLIARGPLVWGWAGDEDAQQDLAMQILEAGPIDLRRKRSEIKATVNALAGQVFAALDEPASLRLLFVWWAHDEGKAVVMRTGPSGKGVRSVFLDEGGNVEMIGSEAARLVARFGQRFLGIADVADLTLEQAKTLAYKLISDVGAVVDDVGGAISMFTITKAGPEQMGHEELGLLADTAGQWTDSMREQLSGATPSEATGPDEGVEPPGRAP
jgi:20S proteasome alpha/beta subunit